MLSKAENKVVPGGLPAFNISWRENIVYICFAAVLVFFAFTIGDKGFLTVTNLFNIARTTAMIAVISVAMTFVISSGELDLSVGSTAALAALCSALAMQAGLGFLGGVAAGLLAGLAVGLINGFFVTVISIPSFLVTLGMMQLIRGVDMRVTYTNPVPVRNETFDVVFGPGTIGVVPTLFLWALLVAAIGHFVLRYTPFGRQVLATGGNREAARYSGINTRRTKVICFIITGMGAALAGMLWTGMMGTARYNFGEGAELAAIAAVILGGTNLFGGKGTIVGTFVGALLIGTINNGLIIMGLDVSEQMMVAGAIIVLAVAFGKKPGR
ncbi:ABC transporter permease [Maliponia aquimaris]|uniref:Ribose transport system permease protein RbsC n=1 Tax=Maliponia aquimaris TaxID=1673631 RepID=A0A238K687_9RHOB|nr:ABC transporter permease [Maliponia aquimaris]SMX37954.1 Ribose transport system permease protein RbsC [Maliponia aquimaris]